MINTEITLGILIIIITFCLAGIVTDYWIRVARKNKLEGKDMNKYSKPLVAEAGGIAVIATLVFPLLVYIFIKTFFYQTEGNLVNLTITVVTILLACFIGFIDDILGWKKGLKQWQKLLLTLPVAIPLIVINAGEHIMNVPFLGNVDFGLFYPLFLIPLAMIGTTNGYNILAGYNGLEASLGVVIFGFLGIVSLTTGQFWLALTAGIIVASLLGFLIYNKFPSRVFPGDSLTYSLGALITLFAVFGNMEKMALILFIPFILEGILKLRSRLKAENFGIPNKDNSLERPYDKHYSLTHLAITLIKKIKPSHKVYEKDVVLFIVAIEFILGVIILI